MTMDRTLCRWTLSACLVLAACGEPTDQALNIDATATVAGRVFVDRNGNDQVDEQVDAVAPGVRVALVRSLGDTVGTAITDAQGWGVFRAVPVGSYRLVVDPRALGDTLRLVQPDSTRFVATASDSIVAFTVLGYPFATAAEVPALPAGRVVSIDAVALHRANLFGDSTLHLRDAGGTLRVVQLSPGTTAAAGDSVRVLGRVGSYLGRPALAGLAVFQLGTAVLPPPQRLSTAEAASAGDGRLDASLVEVRGARILESATLPGGDTRLRVDDGSGVLEVILDRLLNITSTIDDPLVPGVSVDVTGILVPNATGARWQLKPRGRSDLIGDVPEATIAEARRLDPGRLASVTGVAVSGIATFGDNTVHLQDATGSIRVVVSGSPSIFAGDSLRLLGLIGIRDGQPALVNALSTILGPAARVPPPSLLNTGVAATAREGDLDAALVEVRGAVIDTIVPAGAGSTELRVDDGSGRLVVILDPDTGIGASSFTMGERINVVGVLVPRAGGGSWVLKPRSPADITRP